MKKENSSHCMILDILFMPFGFLAPEYFKIIWLSNILALSVYDEGHSVHDEGHSVTIWFII
jgi:hypothetical protein